MADVLDYLQQLEEALMRLSDGSVDPGDTEFVQEQVDKLKAKIDEGLESLIDEPHEQKNIMYGLAGITMARQIIMFKKLFSK